MFRFGHFSDIHFEYKTYDTNSMRDDLINKLKEIGPLHAIFVTGDIFYKGDTSRNAISSVKRYIERMATASNCDLSNVFICAGNHDLKRNEARAVTLANIIERYKKDNKILKTRDYSSIVYGDYCIPFNKICKQITGITSPNKIHRFVPLQEVNLVILNTAIFSGQTYPKQDGADKTLDNTNLFICDDKFEKLKADIRDTIDRNKLTIVLGHHGIECFESEESIRLKKFFNFLPCDLYLCGHIHAISSKAIENTENTYQLSCGGPFKDYYNTPSFIIGEYNSDNHTLDMMLYKYENCWALDNQALPPWKEGKWRLDLKRFLADSIQPSNMSVIFQSVTRKKEGEGKSRDTYINQSYSECLRAYNELIQFCTKCTENLKMITPGASSFHNTPSYEVLINSLTELKISYKKNKLLLSRELCEELESFMSIYEKQVAALESFDEKPLEGYSASEIIDVELSIEKSLSDYLKMKKEEMEKKAHEEQ